MEILEGLDDAQRAGVLAGGGLVVLPSGAGTGKTRVLTSRIAHLVAARGQDAAGILDVTFTNRAAREMLDRAVALGGASVAAARIQTLHSLAARIVRRHFSAAGLASRDWGIASPAERSAAMCLAVDMSGVLGPADAGDPEASARRREFAAECERRIDRWKENGLAADDVRAPGRPRRGAADEDCARVYLAYDETMRGQGLVDFGDLTILAVRALERDPAVLAEEAGRIMWMMVDEAQDINRIQLRLVTLLASACGNLLLVGDDDQSLYSFRGAIERLMDRAPLLMPELAARGVTVVRLVANRRCTDAVLAPANLLVDYNTRDEPKVLRSGRDGPAVSVSGHPTDAAEAEAVARSAARLIAEGTAPERIAVLGRAKFPMQTVERAFVKANIPHSMQAGNGFIERSEVQDVLAYLRLAADPDAGLPFTRIAARPTRGLGAAAVDAVLGLARGNGVPLHEALAMCGDAKVLKAKAAAEAARLGQQLATLARGARNGEPSADMVRFVLDDIGYRAWAASREDAPRTLGASFEALADIARAQPSFTEFLSDMCLLADPEERAAEGVHLGTLHGSKGLEWDHVFIVAMEEGVLPHQRAIDEGARPGDPGDPWDTGGAGGIEEERRLAHVGLTRARQQAHVSFAMQRGLGPMRRPSKPSRFLREAELGVPKVQASFAQAQAARSAKGPAKRRTSFL